MGQAKMRGTYDERVSAAIAKRDAREAAWNAAQAERRRIRLEEKARADAIRPKGKSRVAIVAGGGMLSMALAVALGASMTIEPKGKEPA